MSEKQAVGRKKGSREDMDLSDVIDPRVLQSIFDDFYRIAPVPMAILDMQGEVIVDIGRHEICTCFYRVNPESRKNCQESKLEFAKDVEPGKFFLFKCKNGMLNAATPIYAGDKKLGNFFMGNFFLDDEEIDCDLFREQARRLGFDEDEYMAALDRVPRISHETIDSAMSFFIKLGRYLSDQGMANLKLARVIEQNRVLLNDIAVSRERFELFLNSTTEITFLKDAELRYEMVNEAYLEFLRKTRDEVIGGTDSELMPRDLAKQCLRSDQDIISSGKPAVTQEFLNGRVFESRKFPVLFSDGKVGVGGFIREVTDLWKAEEEKKESEERFRSVFENTTIGLYRTTPDGMIQMANPALLKMHGCSTFEELAERNLNKEGYGPDYQRRTFMNKIEREGEIIGLEAAWTRKDGTVFFVRESARVFKDADGNVLYYEGTIEDITERKKAEEALKNSEERFRSIFDNATIGLYRTSPEGNIQMANPTLVKMLGYSTFEELAGRDLNKEGFEPDYQRRTFMEKIESEGVILGLEAAWSRRDGTVLFVRESARAFRGPEGNILYYEGTVEDVTERKKAEEALRKSEALLRISGKLASLGGWSVDISDDRVTWSDEVAGIHEMPAGFSPTLEEAKGFYAPEYRERIDKVFDDCVRYGNPYDEEMELITKSGRRVWVREIGQAVRDDSGNIVQAWGAFQDITSIKNVEDTLRRSEDNLRRALQTTIEVLTQTVERRDPYTAGHQRRVADLASKIAAEMGLEKERVEGIRTAGYVHDIGKISVPSEILSKPGKLSEIEMNIIREHPAHGREILIDIESTIQLAEAVHQHHERFDGSGYPQGLKGDDILLEARILSIADVVEAMASHRPYRPSLGIEEALGEIEKNSGILYDAQVANVCLSLFREKGYSLIE